MLYNYPNATDYVGLMQYIETGVPVPFGEISVLIVFAVSFMIFMRYGVPRSFAAASFISFLMGLFLFLIGILPNYFLSVLEVLVASSVILLYFSEG